MDVIGSENGDEVWKRDEIDSPCVKVCVVHPQSRLCMGCYRSVDEISAWSKMTPEARREIIAALPERAPLVKGQRRKRRR